MNKRKKLKISAIVSGAEKNSFEYVIDSVIGDGANSIVYGAHYIDSDNGYHSVRLKECYPYTSNIKRLNDVLIWENEPQKRDDINKFKNAYHKLLDMQNNSNISNATAHTFDLIEANGTLYSVMDTTVGETFDKDKTSSLIDILKTIRALSKVVGEYHNNGYLHLDIKPSNFLTIPETRELVVLFDVDTVMPMADIPTGQINYVPFSNNWAAPEQMQGKIIKLCPATDIFSIGAILFEKVMDRKFNNEDMAPFVNWNFQGEMFDKVNPKIKPLLSEIFHKTLSANIKRRFMSCDELIAVLDEAIKILVAGKPFIIGSCPASLNNFIGRKQDIEEIKSTLKHKNDIFVYGIAGTGKTELAKKYAELFKRDFDTVVFCKYDNSLISTLRNITIENADYSESTDVDFINKELPKLVDDKLLIILDNFDVDIDQEEYLKDFLNLNCKKIITTRTNFHGINSSIYELKNLENEECFDLFIQHSKIEKLTEKDKKSLIDILERIAYNTYFITILAKRMYEKNIPFDRLCNEVESKLLKKSGKIVTYKDGKQNNKTIYEIAKTLFNMDGFSEDEFSVLRNLYMLRWRTVTIKDYEKIACYNADEDFIENKKDALNKLERLGWVLNSNDASRQIYLHPIVLELAFEELHPSVDNCSEIAKYYHNRIIEVLSDNDRVCYRQWEKGIYIHHIFAFYKSLDIKSICNLEYVVDSIYVSYVVMFGTASTLASLVYDFLFNKNYCEALDLCDDKTRFKWIIIYIWFVLKSICEDCFDGTLESICESYFNGTLDNFEEEAIRAITAIYEHCLNHPTEDNIRFFAEGVMLFSKYFELLVESGNIKNLLQASWTFKEDEFLKIEKYIYSLKEYMTTEQKKICIKAFSHNLKKVAEDVVFSTIAAALPDETFETDSQKIKSSKYREYEKSLSEKRLFVAMDDSELSCREKIDLAKSYYENSWIDSLFNSPLYCVEWKCKEQEDKHRYNRYIFLKDLLSEYGSEFDKSTYHFNYIRWMYACLSLIYNIEDFHKNMDILMKQLKEITLQRIESSKEINDIWEPFEERADFFEYEDIDNQSITKYVLPYIKDYLVFCEALFDSKNMDKKDWYLSVHLDLHIYLNRHNSENFSSLFKEYKLKCHNAIGIDYTLTKKR